MARVFLPLALAVFICVHLWFHSLFVFSVPLRLNRFTEFAGKNRATGRASNPAGLSAGQRSARWAEGEMPGRRPGRARRRRCVRRHEEPRNFANGAAACRRPDRAANKFPPSGAEESPWSREKRSRAGNFDPLLPFPP